MGMVGSEGQQNLNGCCFLPGLPWIHYQVVHGDGSYGPSSSVLFQVEIFQFFICISMISSVGPLES